LQAHRPGQSKFSSRRASIAIQSTRPQTLAYGLTDSPVGQLAWMIDKFREWTHPRDTRPDAIIDIDRLLTNTMIYWLTGTAGSSAYVGYAQAGGWGAPAVDSGVPTGAATSPLSRSRPCWWPTSPPSSAGCADGAERDGRVRGARWPSSGHSWIVVVS
jgi:hypothetical protein